MNLGQMRAAVRANVLDPWLDYITDDANGVGNQFVNQAMLHVCNWADRQDESLFITTATTGTLSSSADDLAIALYGTPTPTFNIAATARLKRIIAVDETSATIDTPLQMIRAEEKHKYKVSGGTATPACFLAGNQFFLVSPSTGLALKMYYVQEVPNMEKDNDIPGQASGSPTMTVPVLPEMYHPLIVTYATVLALAAEGSDTAAWREIYAEQRDEMLATLTKRRGARIGSPA